MIRLILAAIKQREVDERIELDDADVLAVHREDDQAAPRFDQPVRSRRPPGSGRLEKAEIGVLSAYLPAQMGEAEVDAASTPPSRETGAAGAAGHGQGDGACSSRAWPARADMGKVSAGQGGCRLESAKRFRVLKDRLAP